jgi:zinc transporter 1
LTFGYQRAQLLGAFFNGVFLVALGISILVQSVERFLNLENVKNPELMLIMGCIGLALNIISAVFLHEHHGHDHGQNHSLSDDPPLSTDGQRALAPAEYSSTETLHGHAEHRHNMARIKAPGRDLGMLGVLAHVICDAMNNIGVIIAALVMWRTNYSARYFADPGASMGISVMILLSSIPLVKNSGAILLQSAPRGVDLADIKHDLEKAGFKRSLRRQEYPWITD